MTNKNSVGVLPVLSNLENCNTAPTVNDNQNFKTHNKLPIAPEEQYMELDGEDKRNENYSSVTHKFLPNATSSLYMAKTKDKEILEKLSNEDEWIEVAKYK